MDHRTMKMLRFVAVLALLLAASPAVAQWQVKNHSVPIGRGVGTTGFGAANPGAAGQPIVSSGLTLDPVFGQAANNGIQPGAADTYKGSLNGTATSDVAWPSCTGLGQAVRYALGVGPNCGTVVATTGFDMPINLGLSASSNGTALTFTVTQANGSAPTTGNPVVTPFRVSPLTLGTVNPGSNTGSLSLSIPSGATLGTSNGVPFRVWIFLVANNGTPAIGVATCSITTTIFPCSAWETTLKTSVAMSAGATAAGTLYAAVGVTNDAVRIIGFCDYSAGLATAGTWASACTTLQLMGPGVKKPGDVVQTVVSVATTAGTTSSATFAALSSSPSAAITPTTTINPVEVAVYGTMAVSTGTSAGLQLQRGSTLIGNPAAVVNGANATAVPVSILVIDVPQSVSAQTYSFQGKTAAGTLSFPSTLNLNTGSYMTLKEIMG